MRSPHVGGVLIAALALAGCGHTHVVGPSRVLQMTLREYRLIPQDVRTRSGGLTIYVHNLGRLTHNLVVSLHGQTAAATGPIFPGQTAQLSVNLPPGQYSMASTILSDQALGEYGTLTVTR